MKQTRNGHLLNTDTAKLLAVSQDETQRLYKTRGGVYFLYIRCKDSETLRLIDQYEARSWAETNISTEEYLRLFRLPHDTKIRFCLSSEAKKILLQEEKRSGKACAQIVNDLILAYL